ncbi:phage-like element PBSX protein XkdU [Geomicrobium sp. JCM 19039]|nr:phage-like element PBSX protein XkdU [Geomicrobium sp. JCM 19039]
MLINKRSNIPPITIRALQRSVNQFLLNPSAKVKLDHENYHLFATVSAGDLRYETQIFQTVETMKPAHLRFSLSLEYEGIRSGWREETSINQFSCPVPREELYPLNDLIPC